ncbi:MAG: COX15/CtaA family protein [Bacteroidetes bacterium]|nr:COX15/CtaA family protein [Bacteroidota bacterium]
MVGGSNPSGVTKKSFATNSSTSYRPVIIWLLTGCFLIYAMVVIGGITRLTGSGLSITEWKIVTGTFPPLSQEAWQKEFDAYKQIPQYKLINSDFQLSDFKQIFFWEYLHRLIGRIIGVVFLIPFIWFWIKKKLPEGFMKKALVLFALGGLQGFLGWFMVKSGLSQNVHVSHYRLAIHLISAFTVFGFTFWYALDFMSPSGGGSEAGGGLKKLSLILFSTIILQIIYGAFVAGLKAGYGYPTWPKMGDEWFPSDITSLEPLWKNFFEGVAGVQFIHRYIAYVIVIIVRILFYRSRKLNLTQQQRKIINALVIIVLAQFILGVITLLYGVPIIIAVLHQTGAFFLFATSLLLIHRTK